MPMRRPVNARGCANAVLLCTLLVGLPDFLAWMLPASMQSSPGALLVFAIILMIALEAVSQIRGVATNLLKTYTVERIALRFRSMLFSHAQRLSLSHHDRMGSSDAVYRIRLTTKGAGY